MSKDSTLYAGLFEINSSKDEMYHFANGYIDIELGHVKAYCFSVKDHLGNVRHVDRSTPGRDNGIVQISNYYPFDGILNESFNRVDYQNKLYNGKELDRMHGLNLYDYSARQYDAALGQFTSIDPLCEVDYYVSPYSYCGGNPVNRVDKDGRIWNYVVGAAIGAATEYACQVATNLITRNENDPLVKCFTDVNGKQILYSAAEGAIGVGLATKAKSIGKIAKTVIETSLDAGSGALEAAGEGKDIVSGALNGVVQGKITKAAGYKVTGVVQKKINGGSKKKMLDQVANHDARVAKGEKGTARAQRAEKSKKKADSYGNTRSNCAGTITSEATSTVMDELYNRNRRQGN